jgi:hypothetical protein
MNPTSEIFGWAILAATFLGPIFAVLVTRYIDSRREIRNRRLYIFRALMATRRAQLTQEHIVALNLIEIDFRGQREVLAAWKDYFANLSVDPNDQAKAQRAYAERPQLLTRLLHAIAKVVRYKIEQLDIMAGGYTPQLVYDNFQAQIGLQIAAMNVLTGKQPLLVKNVDGAESVEDEVVEEPDAVAAAAPVGGRTNQRRKGQPG